MADETALRTYLDGRLAGLRTVRYSWWVAWAELAEYILPRRYVWLVTPNQYNRGAPLNARIVDATGTIAAWNCANGMMSGITSPTRPWFKLTIEGFDQDQTNPVNIWLAECERRMMRVFSESNFYNAMATVYLDLVVFGSAATIIYEDYDNVIHCYNPSIGEFYFGVNRKLQVGTFYREMILTLAQISEMFPGALTPEDRKVLENGGGHLERKIGHAIEPNDGAFGIPKHFSYREVYWEIGGKSSQIYSKRGFYELPFIAPRWDVASNDAYGRSPGMDALGDIKQLQQETRRKAQALDKMVNPPMVGDIQLQNQPASTLPGGVTYVSSTSNVKFAPAYQVNPPLQEISADLHEIQERIRNIFFNDLFLMISQLDTVRSASEIDARKEEKLIMLGPVLERLENEALDPAINRVFGIMFRGGLLPPAPPEIRGGEIQVQYVSMLAEAQRATSTAGIERLLSLVGSMAAVDPQVLDKLDFDKAIDLYNSFLRNSPLLIRDDAAVAALREQRRKQQEAQQQLQVTDAAVKGAKTLSETQLGAGNNALQEILGGQ